VSIETRKQQERRDRYQRIVATARGLAESEGWDAVTTRRLADLIDYSQPVLYSHFAAGKRDIMRAVALEGFAELAEALHQARSRARGARPALCRLCAAYLDFAAAAPALYEAMFILPVDLEFASENTPLALRAAFAEFLAVLEPFAEPTELQAEILWSTLHGMAVLSRAGRIPAASRDQRLDLLVEGIAGVP
jgi:AcrR family transcriptional regulator